MKTRTLDQRPWCPGGFVTHSGLVLNAIHVEYVSPIEDWRAAREVTAIIYRMLHS